MKQKYNFIDAAIGMHKQNTECIRGNAYKKHRGIDHHQLESYILPHKIYLEKRETNKNNMFDVTLKKIAEHFQNETKSIFVDERNSKV